MPFKEISLDFITFSLLSKGLPLLHILRVVHKASVITTFLLVLEVKGGTMEQIKDTLADKKIEKESGRDPQKWHEMAVVTAEMLDIELWRAKKKMKGWSADKIEKRYLYVQKHGRNPAALWTHLYKQENNE